MINIEEDDLQKVIKEKSSQINYKSFPLESLISLLVFIISLLTVNLLAQPLYVKIIAAVVVVLDTVYFSVQLGKYIKNRYTPVDFYQDIVKSSNTDQIHRFSLIVLKDGTNYRYLLRKDKRWDCFLFPYKKTMNEDKAEIEKYISAIFSISDFSSLKTFEDDIEKYSYSAREVRKYHHTFYCLELKECHITDGMINGEKYRWFSMDEMKRNKKIMQKNKETVSFIEEHF